MEIEGLWGEAHRKDGLWSEVIPLRSSSAQSSGQCRLRDEATAMPPQGLDRVAGGGSALDWGVRWRFRCVSTRAHTEGERERLESGCLTAMKRERINGISGCKVPFSSLPIWRPQCRLRRCRLCHGSLVQLDRTRLTRAVYTARLIGVMEEV
ncbi:hypothetical protein MPH_06243 [Macrophomina phaseolina MS6]|uniref:Uncharacterized protein n=1 Tax=Macrophomina phaseolina (strain MS6) TaxID=1126212 RepID=K2RUT6_MACPH|nr:hypothetical protein MPH_06243 [Macrophomina phaseolina MS6]